MSVIQLSNDASTHASILKVPLNVAVPLVTRRVIVTALVSLICHNNAPLMGLKVGQTEKFKSNIRFTAVCYSRFLGKGS